MHNPHDEFLIDEVSGIKVPDEKHQIWEAGYKACRQDMINKIGHEEIASKFPHFFDDLKEAKQMINHVIRWDNDMVMVFDEKGEQILAYQGRYEEVKDKILAHAPESAKFFHGIWSKSENVVSREDW